MQIETKFIKVARVLFEDDDFITLEIAKDDERQLRIEDNDRFYCLVFLNTKQRKFWVPWKSNV